MRVAVRLSEAYEVGIAEGLRRDRCRIAAHELQADLGGQRAEDADGRRVVAQEDGAQAIGQPLFLVNRGLVINQVGRARV